MQTTDLKGLRDVAAEAWLGGFTVSGDFARKYAAWVAMAASMQMISTQHAPYQFGRKWFITNKGLRWLNEQFTELENNDAGC